MAIFPTASRNLNALTLGGLMAMAVTSALSEPAEVTRNDRTAWDCSVSLNTDILVFDGPSPRWETRSFRYSCRDPEIAERFYREV